MTTSRALSIPLYAALTLAACNRPAPDPTNLLAARVDSLADAVFAARLELEPEFGTSSGLTKAHHGRITDNSPAGIGAAHTRWDALSAVATTIDPAPLVGRPQWVTYGMVREGLEAEHGLRVCRLELWGVASYVNGWQAIYTDLARLQPVGTDSARAHALERLRALPRFLGQEIANLREGLKLGYSSPKVIVRNVIGQLDGILATPVPRSPFHSPAERDTTPAFRAEYERLITDELNPAIRRYRDFLAQEYQPAAREALGVSANPDGAACYRASLRSFATVDLPADSVFSTGLAQIARVESEMRVIATRSFGAESLPALLQRLRTDPRYTFRTSQEIIDTSQAVMDRAKQAMAKWFGRMGMLASEGFRAARMVIDAGVHTKGWSREQALTYLLGHTVLPRRIAEGEVDRYISWPGQAPSYMIGRLEILRLREQARTTLGTTFDIRAFHDRVLEDGTVPLGLLRIKIERWVAARGPGAPR